MEYQRGEKVVLEVYSLVMLVLRKLEGERELYLLRGWNGDEWFNWVGPPGGIRPLTPEEEEMDFDEWETETDYEAGIAACDAAMELALITHDKEWFESAWRKKRAFIHLKNGQDKRLNRRKTK